MDLHTTSRDEALLEEIARYFEVLASDCEAMAARNYSRKENSIKATVWRDAAADVRSIRLDPA